MSDEAGMIWVCSVVALYSTGHWIGATILVAIRCMGE